MENVILLTWLHNIYLQPFGRITCRAATSKYMNELHTQGLIELVNGYVTRVCITPKGKKFLQRNIATLHQAWLEEEIMSRDFAPAEKVIMETGGSTSPTGRIKYIGATKYHYHNEA